MCFRAEGPSSPRRANRARLGALSFDELAHGRGWQGLVTAVSDPDRRRVLDMG